MNEQSFLATIHQKTDPDLLQLCLFLAFLSQEEPKKISEPLKDSRWVEAMQEELLQFQIQNVWGLVDCPKGVRPIGTKWVLKKQKDKGENTLETKPDWWLKDILRKSHASYMGFTVYPMDVKSGIPICTIDDESIVMQPSGFQDP
ncbi:hypothetical protein Tco_1024536 [Tanacetum coccineum]